MPYPKVAPRVQSSRGRKRGRSRILTDTPEKAEIEELALKKKAKEAAINKKRDEKLQKLRNTKLLFISTDEEEDDLPSLLDSSGGSDFLSDDEVIDDTDPEPDDYVLVKFPHKKKTVKFYVGKVLCVKRNALKVKFLRRKGLVGSCFTFPTVEDISEVDRANVQKLPQPTVSRTAWTADIIKFNHKFHLNVF